MVLREVDPSPGIGRGDPVEIQGSLCTKLDALLFIDGTPKRVGDNVTAEAFVDEKDEVQAACGVARNASSIR
jgi:hypothetical protein